MLSAQVKKGGCLGVVKTEKPQEFWLKTEKPQEFCPKTENRTLKFWKIEILIINNETAILVPFIVPKAFYLYRTPKNCNIIL